MKKVIIFALLVSVLLNVSGCFNDSSEKGNGRLEPVGVSESEQTDIQSSAAESAPTPFLKGSEPIKSVGILKSAYGKGPNGEDAIFAGTTGNPSMFNVIDAKTGKRISTHRLQGEPQVWGIVVDPKGDVYFSEGANLYRYTPSNDMVENLGKPIESESVVWHVASDEKGRIFGTSYPNGKVFMYDSKTEKFTDFGTMLEGQQYTRSIATYKDKVYVGTGTEAHLMELNPETHEIREIDLPAKYRGESFVYDLDIVEDYMYARVTDSATLLVYDLKNAKWIEEISNVKGITVSPASETGHVYFNKDDKLFSYHPYKRELKELGLEESWGNKGFGWIELDEAGFEGQNLICTLFEGVSWIYNPQSEQVKYVTGEFKKEPIVIQSMHTGPDEKMYMGGYLSGGLASYSPSDQMLMNYGTFPQIENMVSSDKVLYLGTYTKSVIYKYNPKRPFEYDRSKVMQAKNPKKIFSLEEYGQDRPFGMAYGDHKLFVGTVPSYGKLGGALAFYDEQTEKHEVFPNIIPNQSIVELQYHDGFVYGSTSIYGGLGTEPVEKEAKIFIFDPLKKEVVYEGVPIAGEKAISTLQFDENGHLWGMSPGKIFKFDVKNKKVLHTQELFSINQKETSHYWKGAELIYHSNGQFYGVTKGNLFTYDSVSAKMEVIDTGVSVIEKDSNGQLYVTKGTKMYQLKK